MSWVFEESNPMGGAAGEAYANTLRSQGMHPEHVLAREAIQNSVDAGINGGKVLVRFRRKRITGASKAEFIASADLHRIAARVEMLALPKPNCLQTLDSPKKGLSLLYIEDHNAEGLSGDPHDKGSHFYRLLLSLGDRSKTRTTKGSGGSYGFGKSVYSSSSAIQTIFAYTRFSSLDGHEHTRLFGCGYYRSHEFKGKSFGGRAWLGKVNKGYRTGQTVVDPLEDKAADEAALRLGFEPRGDGALGTTILIIDAAVDLDRIIRGVEDWWWPRLIEQRLDVEIYDEKDTLRIPRPKKHRELQPFIEAFEIARLRAQAKQGEQKYKKFNKLNDKELGACGFVLVPVDENGPVVAPQRCNTVALIRAPLMVVTYSPFSQQGPFVVGAFIASDDIDQILRLSEPPAHDRWDFESGNLRDQDGDQSRVVDTVLRRIRHALHEFQADAAPPAPPQQHRLSVLERALGSLFRPLGSGPRPRPDADAVPLHLIFARPPAARDTGKGTLQLRSAFSVTLDNDADDDEVALWLRIGCPVLEDEGHEGEDLALCIEVKGVKAERDPDDSHVARFHLRKGAKAQFEVESAEYDPAWTVRFKPEIEREALA